MIRVIPFISTVLMFSIGCSSQDRLENTKAKTDTGAAMASNRVANKVRLTNAQSIVALSSKTLQVAVAEYGYATNEPSVIVAELEEGSGVAYISWIVLRINADGKWESVGQSSGVHILAHPLHIEIGKVGSSWEFRAAIGDRKNIVVLSLP